MKQTVWTIPNAVSFSRLLGLPLIPYFALVLENDFAAFLVFAIASITDWLDGWLARKLNQYSDLGAQLDPIADRLYIIVALVVLVMRGLLPWWMVAIIFLRDVFMLMHQIQIRRAGFSPQPVHYLGKAGTLMILYAVPFIFLGQIDTPITLLGKWVGYAFFIWGIFTYWYAGFLYRRQWVNERFH
jgi:cardiolipin synthase